MILEQIISGAQTGADQGGLYAAKDLGIPTGGYMPKGWLTEDGPDPDMAGYFNLMEAGSSSYYQRTKLNVMLGDGTVIFGNRKSRGSALTYKLCADHYKPVLPIDLGKLGNILHNPKGIFIDWIKINDIKILNVAGNRESVAPGIQESVRSFLTETFREISEEGQLGRR